VKLVNGILKQSLTNPPQSYYPTTHIAELGQLSADKLMEYLRNLQTVAVTLGEEESKQFARAKCLNIFGKEH